MWAPARSSSMSSWSGELRAKGGLGVWGSWHSRLKDWLGATGAEEAWLVDGAVGARADVQLLGTPCGRPCLPLPTSTQTLPPH